MKKYFITLLAFLFTVSLFGQWVQVGDAVVGDENQDRFGWSVATNNDGSRFISSAALQNVSGSTMAYTKVYELINDSWQQIGSTIEESNNNFGDSYNLQVGMSGDGSRIVVANDNHLDANGRARLFEFDGSEWMQLGVDIVGESFGELGDSVGISRDGNTIVVGEKSFNSTEGRVRTYVYDGNNLVQVGQSLTGGGDVAFLGTEVAINDNGTRIATVSSNGPTGGGETKVYELNGNTWQQVGSTLNSDGFGGSTRMALDGLGENIIISNLSADANGENSGVAIIYDLVNNIWEQKGDIISGSGEGHSLGDAADISQNGDLIVVSSTTGEPFTDFFKVFKFINGNWEQIDGDVPSSSGFRLKPDVAIDVDGNYIITSSILGNGSVEVYQNENILSTNNFDSNSFEIHPNPATSQVTISNLNDLQVSKISLVDVAGRTVIEHVGAVKNTSEISLRNLSSGVYFVTVYNEKGILVKRLIVK